MSSPPSAALPPPRRQRVCVIGSGIAGLSSAWFLSQHHDVTLIERSPKLGMDAHAVTNPDGTHFDVPLRIFNPEFYPNLTALYDEVGVRYGSVSSAFSCTYMVDVPANGAAADNSSESESSSSSFVPSTFATGLAYFRYSNCKSCIKFPYPSLSLNPRLDWVPGYLSAVRRYASLMYSITYFFFMSPIHLRDGELEGLTLGTYLTSRNYSQSFIHDLLYPMLSVVCTCSYANVAAYPAEIIVSYYSSYGTWSWFPSLRRMTAVEAGDHCRVLDGVKDVVDKLSKRTKTIHLGCEVLAVTTADGTTGPTVTFRTAATASEAGTPTTTTTPTVWKETFDAVVIASQAHHASAMLKAGEKALLAREDGEDGDDGDEDGARGRRRRTRTNAARELREALDYWTYEKSRVVVHTDERLMPARREDWSEFNLVLEDGSAGGGGGGGSGASAAAVPSPSFSSPSSSSSESVVCPAPMSRLDASMCSVWMNSIDSSLSPRLLQTWNPVREPRSGSVISDSWFERPLLTLNSLRGIRLLKERQGKGGLYFVGAYSLYSMPLLESGVKSSCYVSTMLGAPPIWGDRHFGGEECFRHRTQGNDDDCGERGDGRNVPTTDEEEGGGGGGGEARESSKERKAAASSSSYRLTSARMFAGAGIGLIAVGIAMVLLDKEGGDGRLSSSSSSSSSSSKSSGSAVRNLYFVRSIF